jgi:hypothetical protein
MYVAITDILAFAIQFHVHAGNSESVDCCVTKTTAKGEREQNANIGI